MTSFGSGVPSTGRSAGRSVATAGAPAARPTGCSNSGDTTPGLVKARLWAGEGGQRDGEHLAAVAGGLGPDAAAHGEHQVLGDGEAQARPAALAGARGVDLVEPLED